MGWKTWTGLVLGVLLLALNVLFYLQNSLRLTDLSLDLYFWAAHLQAPLPVPLVLYGAFAVGVLVGGLVMGGAWRRAVRRASELERQVARGGGSAAPAGDLWT